MYVYLLCFVLVGPCCDVPTEAIILTAIAKTRTLSNPFVLRANQGSRTPNNDESLLLEGWGIEPPTSCMPGKTTKATLLRC